MYENLRSQILYMSIQQTNRCVRKLKKEDYDRVGSGFLFLLLECICVWGEVGEREGLIYEGFSKEEFNE